jgi:hypothetical protein
MADGTALVLTSTAPVQTTVVNPATGKAMTLVGTTYNFTTARAAGATTAAAAVACGVHYSIYAPATADGILTALGALVVDTPCSTGVKWDHRLLGFVINLPTIVAQAKGTQGPIGGVGLLNFLNHKCASTNSRKWSNQFFGVNTNGPVSLPCT